MTSTPRSQENLLAADPATRETAAEIPLARLGTVEDVVDALPFFGGDGATYVTRATQAVDGGWSSLLPGAAGLKGNLR